MSADPRRTREPSTISRPGTRLSRGVRELVSEVENHMRDVAEEFDRAR